VLIYKRVRFAAHCSQRAAQNNMHAEKTIIKVYLLPRKIEDHLHLTFSFKYYI